MAQSSTGAAPARRNGVQSVEVGAALIEAMIRLGASSPLTELAHEAGMPAAKAHRYLASLCESGLARQDDVSGFYGFGPLALRLGLAAIAQHDVVERAHEMMTAFCLEARLSGHLSVWSEAGPIVIRSAHGGPPVISPVAVGSVMPLFRSATGRVFLAYMPRPATAALAPRPEHAPPSDPDEADAARADVAAAGYAVASGQYAPGLYALALPIFHHDGQLACAVTFITTDRDLFEPGRPVAEDALSRIRAFNAAHSLRKGRRSAV